MNGLVFCLDAGNTKSYGDNTENLITNSEFAYSQLSGNTTATGSQSFVPYGRNTAVNFVNNGGSGNTYIYQDFNTSFTTGTQYVISIFSNSSTISFDQGGLASGKFTLLNSGSIPLGNNWWRHWNLYSATVNNPNVTPQVTITPGQNITLCGWQVERSPTVGPYYATTGTAKNRGTTWTNLLSSGNGTLTNGPTYSSADGGSLVFDGVDDHTQTSYNLGWNNTNSVSIIIFVNPTGNGPFLGKSSYEWRFNKSSNTSFTFTHWDNTLGGQHTNGPVITINDMFTNGLWVSIGFVWNHLENKVFIYKNGVLYNSYNWVDASINRVLSEGVKIGGNIYGSGSGSGGGSYFNGKIGPLSIYNRALTSSEISQNFNAFRGRFGI